MAIGPGNRCNQLLGTWVIIIIIIIIFNFFLPLVLRSQGSLKID